MTILVNIDNGGTFTDVCISDGKRVVHAKAPTTPHDLTQCFLEILARGSEELYGDADVARLIRETDCLRYSTTSGTNAVVEHKGTPVALIVDAGEEQSVYGLAERLGGSALWQAMVPLPPAGIEVSADGAVDSDALTALVNQLLAQGALRLVVALSSEQAEGRIKALLLDRYPRHLLGAIPFLVSSELAPDADLGRRTVTAVVNSYLHPEMEHFLYGAESICKEQHLKRPLLIFRNDGDSARVAKTTAIKTWGSGPRGGVEGAVAYARHYDLDSVVSMDIGGTTTDISVVTGQKVTMRAYGEIERALTSFPLPTIHSFGVGGSSVVRVSDGGIRIGPDSVGAAPGPACFGRGGTDATLTDALLIAGVLDAENYLGGELRLDRERAVQAVEANVGHALGVDAAAAAAAVIEAFQAVIAGHVSAALDEAGAKPRRTTLLAYGGGGPVIATGIARAAGIRQVLIPRLASVFSAFGIGFSHLAHEHQVPLDGNAKNVKALARELEDRARRDMYGEGVDPDDCAYPRSLWSADGEVVETRQLNGGKLKKGDRRKGARLSVRAVYELPSFELLRDKTGKPEVLRPGGTVEVGLNGGAPGALPLCDDSELRPGTSLEGPCLVRGDYLTSIVDRGWSLRVSTNGDLFVEGK